VKHREVGEELAEYSQILEFVKELMTLRLLLDRRLRSEWESKII